MTSHNDLNHKDNKNEVVREFTLKLHATIEEVIPTVDTSPNREIIRSQSFDISQIPDGYEVVSGEKFGGPKVPLLLPENYQWPDGWEMAFRRIYEKDPDGIIVIFIGKPNPNYYQTRYMIEDGNGKMHGVDFSNADDFNSAVENRKEELEYIAERFTNHSVASMRRAIKIIKMRREKARSKKDIKLGRTIDSIMKYEAKEEKRHLPIRRGGPHNVKSELGPINKEKLKSFFNELLPVWEKAADCRIRNRKSEKWRDIVKLEYQKLFDGLADDPHNDLIDRLPKMRRSSDLLKELACEHAARQMGYKPGTYKPRTLKDYLK